MESPEDHKSQEVPKAIMQMQSVNAPNEQKLPQHASACLTDLVMQMRQSNTNMRIRQVNGQRLYGPPIDHVGPPPPKGSEVFVARIPTNVFELELVPLFERVGKIFEMRILINFSGNNRGYGFVQYYTPEEADKAVSILNNFEIRQNNSIVVTKSADNCRLYVSEIPSEKTGDEIFREMARANVVGITRVISASGAGCGGVAFIDFETHAAAAIARRSMMLGRTQLWGKPRNVEWAMPEPQTAILFVRNLAQKTSRKQLEHLFNENSGKGVRRISRIDDTAYICFDTSAHAEQARRALDNSMIEGSSIDVLAIHGHEEMMPKEWNVEELMKPPPSFPAYPDNRPEFHGHGVAEHSHRCGILGCQQFQPFQPNPNIPMVPSGFPVPHPYLNPEYQFPPPTFPGFFQGPKYFVAGQI